MLSLSRVAGRKMELLIALLITLGLTWAWDLEIERRKRMDITVSAIEQTMTWVAWAIVGMLTIAAVVIQIIKAKLSE